MHKIKSLLLVSLMIFSSFLSYTVLISEHAKAETWIIKNLDSIGIVGKYSSIALNSNGHPHITYYDQTNRCLKYAIWNGTTWIRETLDTGGNAAVDSSLAIDSNDWPHISYASVYGDLFYAKWNGSDWSNEAVDIEGVVGYGSSIVLDSSDFPHISYLDSQNSDLKYARWNGTTWKNETVDNSLCWVGSGSSIALDSNGYPHISYRQWNIGNSALRYAKWNGSTWKISIIVNMDDEGGGTSLALDGRDYPHISYCEGSDSDLKYARWDGSSWSIETIDSIGNVGKSSSIAIDSLDCPHISYADTSNEYLKYARWNGSTWNIEIVDSADVRYYGTSIALDSNDYAHISYYEGSKDDLKYAKMVPTVPTKPQNLQVSAGDGYVNLTWNTPSDDGGSTITNYKIYRGTNAGEEIYLATIGDVLQYNDTSVINGQTYYYQISALNSVGEGPTSNEIYATPKTIPLTPQNLQAISGDGFVNLTWAAPADNGGSPITGYNIYRNDTQGVYLSVSANQVWYNDTNIVNGIQYSYTISAINEVGESPISNEVNATPAAVLASEKQEDESLFSLYWWFYVIIIILIIFFTLEILFRKKEEF